MKPELKNCPCCGGSEVHYIGFIEPEKEGTFAKCFGCGNESLVVPTVEEAAELWNYGGCFDKCNNHSPKIAECVRCIGSALGGKTNCGRTYKDCIFDSAEPVTEENQEFAELAEEDGCFHSIDCDRICIEAADEIEKLEAANKRLKEAFEEACKANDDLLEKLTAMKAALDATEERVKYLVAWRDAFSKDFLRGYKEQIEKKRGIYRCDICINGNDNEHKPTGTCSKLKCDGYSHWKWRGVRHEV